MGFNKKVLSKAVSELGKAKAPAKPRDIITDPMGQWKYPGKKTRIPGSKITMEGVDTALWAQPNIGAGKLLRPNEKHDFGDAVSYVDETPITNKIAKKGGTLQSKKYSKSMSATNKLFTKNKLFQNKKSKIFDPNSKFKSGGSKLGPINLNPNPLSHYELNYGFNLPTKQDGGENEDEYMDLTDEEIQAYKEAGYEVDEEPEYEIGGYVQHELVKAQNGKTVKPLVIADPNKYAFRKAAYDDSLNLYNKSKKQLSQIKLKEWDTPVYLKKGVSPKLILQPEYNFVNYQGYNTSGRFDVNMNPNNVFPPPKIKQKIMPIGGIGVNSGNSMGGWYDIYKKPVQPVTFKNGITEISDPKKDKPKSINTISNNTIEPISTLPLRPIQQFTSPQQNIIPGKPYIKPKPNVGPRYGSLAGDENLDLPSNYTQAEREAARRQRDAQEYQRKNLEYQEQQRGNEPVAQMRKQGGVLDTYQKKGEVKTFKRDIKDQDAQSNTGWSTAPVEKKIVATNKKTSTTLKEKLNQTPQQAFDTDFKVVTAKENAELKEKTREQNNAFKNQQMPGYKNYGPQSAGSADWLWTLPIAGPAALEAAGSLGAMSLPGMASVPGATLGNAANAGFIAHGITQTPETIKAWDDVSKGKKSWSDAALETGINLSEFIGSGAGIKSIAQDVNQGSKFLGKTLGTETGLISNVDKYNSLAFKPNSEATKIFKAQETKLNKNLEPYLSKRIISPTKEEQVYESFLSNEAMGKKQAERTLMYDRNGNIINKSEIELPGSPNSTPVRSGLGGMDMSKYEIKNPDYYTQLLGTYDSKVLSPTNKKFYKDLIGSIKNQNGLVTERQLNELQRLKSGNFNFGKKGYQEGGVTEAWEDELDEDEIEELRRGGYVVEDLD